MTHSADEVAMHNRVGNNSRNWVHTAHTLFAASEVLAREHARIWQALRCASKVPAFEQLTNWTDLMLAAFGIECLIKAIWLKQGHHLARDGKYIPICKNEGHRLVKLCRAVGIDLDAREKDALERISFISRAIGRYPIPRSISEGWSHRFSWSSADDPVIKSFVIKLELMLR